MPLTRCFSAKWFVFDPTSSSSSAGNQGTTFLETGGNFYSCTKAIYSGRAACGVCCPKKGMARACSGDSWSEALAFMSRKYYIQYYKWRIWRRGEKALAFYWHSQPHQNIGIIVWAASWQSMGVLISALDQCFGFLWNCPKKLSVSSVKNQE